MSQVEQQNTHQSSLFKSFEEIKPENTHEKSHSLFKSAPNINSHTDIKSTGIYM